MKGVGGYNGDGYLIFSSHSQTSKTMNRGIIILAILTLVGVLIDTATTLRLGSLIKHLEANPIYSYVGIPGILLMNILLFGFLVWAYTKLKSPSTRYIIINTLVMSLIMRVFVIINNWKIGNNPPSLELAKQVTKEMKNEHVVQMAAPFILPFFIGLISFYFFMIDHNIEVKND